ncbi:MAG: hypothetical protein Ct9H300mP30_3360 [Methanobacteriota archaeon]|nr:MAG: hypothetical protein Ct9H300mP30_3360 [Euryarchaeota archaeon]
MPRVGGPLAHGCGGTGDLLAGTIGGLLGQGMEAWPAARLVARYFERPVSERHRAPDPDFLLRTSQSRFEGACRVDGC